MAQEERYGTLLVGGCCKHKVRVLWPFRAVLWLAGREYVDKRRAVVFVHRFADDLARQIDQSARLEITEPDSDGGETIVFIGTLERTVDTELGQLAFLFAEPGAEWPDQMVAIKSEA